MDPSSTTRALCSIRDLELGRVTTGSGGEHIIERSKEVMAAEFPELAARIKFHIPDETEKRHGQAVAAASLPKIG